MKVAGTDAAYPSAQIWKDGISICPNTEKWNSRDLIGSAFFKTAPAKNLISRKSVTGHAVTLLILPIIPFEVLSPSAASS